MPTTRAAKSPLAALLFGATLGACGAADQPAVDPPFVTTPDASLQPVAASAATVPVPIAGTIAVDTFFGVAGSGAPVPPGFGFSVPSGLSGPVVQATKTPPPISGGTMLTSRDGKVLVAADPDRDRIYFVDAVEQTLLGVRTLQEGDEPGRVIEDAEGRFHVVLRGGHAIATLTRETTSPITRREVCGLPRGLAFVAATSELRVACADGKLVSLATAPERTELKVVPIERDARDVVVQGDSVSVTQFRSSQLLRIAADGAVQQRFTPPRFTRQEQQFDNATSTFKMLNVESSPSTVWRAIPIAGGATALLHQRARDAEVQITPGGYGGGGNCGSGIVQSSITLLRQDGTTASVDLGEAALAVDLASDPDGTMLAIAAPGNWGTGIHQVQLFPLTSGSEFFGDGSAGADAKTLDAISGTAGVPALPPTTNAPGDVGVPVDTAPCAFDRSQLLEAQGQVTAVSFVSSYLLAAFEREPAAISFIDVRSGAATPTRLDLAQESRFDTGHGIFHVRASSGVACASCHAEAGDDAHVWTFQEIGARRTQTLRGGILGTEPLHWNGDMADFPKLVTDVFVGRMGGFSPEVEQTSALARWIDRQPALPLAASDSAAAQRGKALFESEATSCSTCHAGAHLTDNRSVDVGTGAVLQVPSLRGVSLRTPIMHDGCAKSLLDRFSAGCGGGDKHGHTSQLTNPQIADLVSYLETL